MPAHEYRLSTAAGARTGKLTQISAVAGALPIPECPLAADNLHRRVGVPFANLRRTAPGILRREDGCTHLTDAARALREVPTMLLADRPKTYSCRLLTMAAWSPRGRLSC
ncbi:DUF2889 domain-containing protein [Streptomyces chlorus]|uniref:DUF2889 domain-containing protein n=1 Tax=Streptomyces chlorus TaxID=887452 RepID=A0ABW1DYR8_9ACTN